MTWKSVAQAVLPQGLVQLARARYSGVRFHGAYQDWRAARMASRGYDDETIVARVLAATLAVQRGEAAYERDSVLFKEPEYDYRLLAGLLRVAAEKGGRLRVLDFGGALGSSYWRHRAWLKNIGDFRLDVGEQARI